VAWSEERAAIREDKSLRDTSTLEGAGWPAVCGKTLEKRKEIVQYHPPRGKPRWAVVQVRKVKK